MSLFAVTREAGSAWVEDQGAFDQPGLADHVEFMNKLAADGVVVCAGPLAGTEAGRIRVLLLAEAASDAEIRRRLADDPWEIDERICTTSIEPWVLLVGAVPVA